MSRPLHLDLFFLTFIVETPSTSQPPKSSPPHSTPLHPKTVQESAAPSPRTGSTKPDALTPEPTSQVKDPPISKAVFISWYTKATIAIRSALEQKELSFSILQNDTASSKLLKTLPSLPHEEYNTAFIFALARSTFRLQTAQPEGLVISPSKRISSAGSSDLGDLTLLEDCSNFTAVLGGLEARRAPMVKLNEELGYLMRLRTNILSFYEANVVFLQYSRNETKALMEQMFPIKPTDPLDPRIVFESRPRWNKYLVLAQGAGNAGVHHTGSCWNRWGTKNFAYKAGSQPPLTEVPELEDFEAYQRRIKRFIQGRMRMVTVVSKVQL